MKTNWLRTSLFGGFLLSVLISGQSLADDKGLKRATLLGVIPNQATPGQPVVLRDLVPSSTASALGLKTGDTITELNEQKVGDFPKLVEIISNITAGEAIVVNVVRDGRPLRLTGKMQPRPFETSKIAEVSYESVSYQDNRLRSIVYKPLGMKKGDKAPAIFFIQGYTCDSIDYGMMPNVTTKQMLEQFVEAGYVTYRVEKPGVGDSVSKQPCSQIDFSTEADAFVHALKTLKSKEYVNTDQVYIWGHSLGVLHSAVVANQEKVAGVIGYGGVYKPWYDYLLDIYSEQAVKHFGLAKHQAQQNAKQVQPFLDDWLNSEKQWKTVLSASKNKSAINANLLPLSGEQIFHRHYSFFRDLNQVNFPKLWKKLNVPVLMMHGSLDIQAIESKWAFDIAKQNGQQGSLGMVIDGAEHGFMRYDNHAAYMQARNNGSYRPGDPKEHFDPRIAEQSLAWIRSLN